MGIRGGAGALDQRIEFWRLPRADGPRDERGEYTAVPVKDFTVWAAREPVDQSRRAEVFLSEKRHSEAEVIFRTRWTRHVNPQTIMATHEIRYTEPGLCPAVVRRYNISRCTLIGRMTEMHFECDEIR